MSTSPRRMTTLRRAVLLILAVAVLSAPLTGCALAARLIVVAEAAAAIHDLAPSPPAFALPTSMRTADNAVGHAVVTGTGGSGLRLNERPGEERLAVLPEGTEVVVECRTAGPTVSGSVAETSSWSRVTHDGRTGYMSDAYLTVDPAGAAVPSC